MSLPSSPSMSEMDDDDFRGMAEKLDGMKLCLEDGRRLRDG